MLPQLSPAGHWVFGAQHPFDVHTSPEGHPLPPVHVPFWQVSLLVQELPSLQAVPFALFGWEQVPFDGSQVPWSWHWSGAGQTTGFVPLQAPLWQASVWVQASLSLQLVPSGAGLWTQLPPWQRSNVHGLLSSHMALFEQPPVPLELEVLALLLLVVVVVLLLLIVAPPVPEALAVVVPLAVVVAVLDVCPVVVPPPLPPKTPPVPPSLPQATTDMRPRSETDSTRCDSFMRHLRIGRRRWWLPLLDVEELGGSWVRGSAPPMPPTHP
jgi:hypothetical protein